ncbi:MAG: CapA family protein [Ruminococcaceae bacterium]|nr:CapA family protein [Oscillospiraceae bacterium]
MKNEYKPGQGNRNQTPRRRKRKRAGLGLALAGILLALVVATAFGLASCINNTAPASSGGGSQSQPASLPASVPVSSSEPEPEPEPEEQRVRFSAVGDNLIHSAVYASAASHYTGSEASGYDFNFCYEPSKYFFEDYDVNWINQESLISAMPASTYPNFNTPVELGQAAFDAGFNVFALSNNHTYDKLAAGITATREFWNTAPDGIINYGLYTNTTDGSGIPVQEMNGMTIAYVAFTDHTNGIPTPSGAPEVVIYTSEYAAMEAKVRAAHELADVVVVSVHWEVENSHNVTQTQRDLAANFANWGADVVIGTHPHVVQELEWITSDDGRQVLVAYSLGNFLSAQSQPDQLIGMALTFDLVQVVDPDGTRSPLAVENVKVYPTVTQYEYYGGQYYSDPRTYMFRDYTDEMASVHPVRGKNGSFGRAYIQSVMEAYVPAEFLVLNW